MDIDPNSEEAFMIREAGKKAVNASWKMMDANQDPTPRISYSQELSAYIPPAEGTIPTQYRYQKSEFGEYLNKAVQLKVNLKSTAH
mmetsp:Transcript_12739/g.17398  ORF Transcript_12739/g.17398 Transcript_12739/m.17398 type:complete len:86 (-) Transcript_12739:238-495(-)|eukprot:CAMPEP_0196573818 /NCGR_PEP_ID=MMETSP1081-20130531/3656_1 /TAXON_ID=36882 /ORGANISM="Pyramimonas amylifera, Strain CCMP720" /LENGTH=85 /DNA_ID=CAMNT_0041891655 /DNA_START=135 /DNA_END=392 /DNA_ORIENTATION=-